nr:protein rep [Actinomyces faecalis]
MSVGLVRGPSRDGAPARPAQAQPKPRASAAKGEAARLGKDANNSSPRAQRYDLRRGIQRFTDLERVRKCGRCSRGEGDLVSLRSADDGSGAGWGNLTTCGSVWACPVCSAKIAARRASDLAGVLAKADSEGLRVSMLTLTMRHRKGQRLADLWKALGHAWSKVTSGKQWTRERDDLGLVGWARAVEVTHGKHGWHVHVHAVFVTEVDPHETTAPAQVWGRWVRALGRHGLDAVADSGGMDWQTACPGDAATMGQYVAKMGTATSPSDLAAEATLGAFKKARGENRTPFQIAASVNETGDADDLDLWHEFERVSHNRRALTWSRSLREFGKVEDITDEEIAAEEAGDKVQAWIAIEDWRATVYERAAEVLDVCEAGGVGAALALLTAWGVPYVRPENPLPSGRSPSAGAV